MPKHIAFLFNARDVSTFIAKKEKGENVIVFASGLDTYDALDKEKIPYQEIKTYPPLSVTMQHYQKAHRIALQFNPTIYASARNFFLEILRSAYLADTIMTEYKPSVVYISDTINESLYRKYHSETFDLLPQAIITAAKLHKIKIVTLKKERQSGFLVESFLSQLLADISHLYHDNPNPMKSSSSLNPNIIISASDYHLFNLKNFVNRAAVKWKIFVLGKSSPKIKASLNPYVEFINVYQFISVPAYLLLLSKHLLKLIFSKFELLPSSISEKITPLEMNICRQFSSVFSYWATSLIFQGEINKFAFNKLIRNISPKFIIASNGIDNYNRTLLLTAQTAGVKDAVIIHHQITDDIDIIEERSGVESMIFIPSQKLATMFHRFPGKAEIIVSGNPVMDGYHYSLNPSHPKFHQPIRILFLLCQEHLRFQEENQKIVLEALSELSKLPKPISVILRNHPQHPEILNHLVQKFPFPIIERNNTLLQEDLIENDIVVTQITSAAVEAIIFRKPMIYLNTLSVRDIRNFATSGVALGVYEISELIPAINSLLKNPEQLGHQQDKFVSKYCGKIDGKASQRIIKILNTIDMKSNSKPIY